MNTLLNDSKAKLQSMKFDVRKIEGIELIERQLYEALEGSKGPIREMCSSILAAGGKKVRPLLVLYSGQIFGDASDKLIQAAVASELIHMASLVHDDIIDNSPLRRSRPSVNAVWGNHFAVLGGDYLFAKAFGILAKGRLLRSMDYMVQAIENMCQGEILQAISRFDCNITREAYYETIARKTAIFLECCCKSGASAADGSDDEIAIIGEYGLHLGFAFQIIDDILDYAGNAEDMGKPKNEDLCQGNITLPLILLMQKKKYQGWIQDIIMKRAFSPDVLSSINQIMKKTGIIHECFSVAVNHIEKAKEKLKYLPQSQYTEILYDLTDMLQARVN